MIVENKIHTLCLIVLYLLWNVICSLRPITFFSCKLALSAHNSNDFFIIIYYYYYLLLLLLLLFIIIIIIIIIYYLFYYYVGMIFINQNDETQNGLVTNVNKKIDKG